MNIPKKLCLLLSFIILFSCAEKLDFTQIDDYVYEPIFSSALTYFTVLPFQFFNSSGIQEYEITQVDDFQAFQQDFVSSNVIKIDFNAEYENEFDREVTILFEFLNSNMEIVYLPSPLIVEANNVNPPPYLEEIIIADHPDILNAEFIRIKASIENTGIDMDPNDSSEFDFKSSITFYIKS